MIGLITCSLVFMRTSGAAFRNEFIKQLVK